MILKGLHVPKKLFQMQKAMLRVCYALIPLVLTSIYLFGWRSVVLIAIVFLFGITTEALFTFRNERAFEARMADLERSQRFLEALLEGPTDRHHFADRLHLGRQR